MRFVSRAVVLLRAKQPYVDWANDVQPGDTRVDLDDARQAGTAFLIPAFQRDEEALEFIDRHAVAMFEHELGMWLDDRSAWPARRDAEAFREWFDVELHEIVVDLVGDVIETEELG